MEETTEEVESAEVEAREFPYPWRNLILHGVAFVFLLAVTILLIRQYIQSRPFDFVSASTQTAAAIENFLANHQIAPAQISATDPLFIQSPRAHYYQRNYIVQLPAHINLPSLETIFERNMRNNNLVVTDLVESASDAGLAVSLGEFTFATLRFEQAERPRIQPISEPVTLSSTKPTLTLPAAVTRNRSIQELTAAAQTNPPETPVPEAIEPYEGWLPAQRRDANSVTVDPADDIQLARIPDIGGTREISSTLQAETPKLAIIIDDGGYGGSLTDTILSLDNRLTLAILPNTPHGSAIAEKAHDLGFEIILHMPMENIDPLLTHPGQITTIMDAARIAELTEDALSQVPQAVGVNNHQGSKYTTDPEAMALFIQAIKDRDLYFIDSRTIHHTAAYNVAHAQGMPSERRDIFLDHVKTEEEVRKRFQEAIDLAHKDGEAIAIGHFHPTTARVLKELLPTLQQEGITLVPASELVQ